MKKGESRDLSLYEQQAEEIKQKLGEITKKIQGLGNQINRLLQDGLKEESPEIVALDAEIEELNKERLQLSGELGKLMTLGVVTKEIIDNVEPERDASGKINKKLIN